MVPQDLDPKAKKSQFRIQILKQKNGCFNEEVNDDDIIYFDFWIEDSYVFKFHISIKDDDFKY